MELFGTTVLSLAMFHIIVSCLVSQDNVKRGDFSPNQPNDLDTVTSHVTIAHIEKQCHPPLIGNLPVFNATVYGRMHIVRGAGCFSVYNYSFYGII